MNDIDLSDDAIKLLEDNGYTFNKSKRRITIKKPSSPINQLILPSLFAVLSVPLILFYSWLGLVLFVLLTSTWLLSRRRFTKESKLNIYPAEEYIECINRGGKDKYTFWYIRSFFLKSKFNGDLHPVPSRNQDGSLTIGVELRSRQFLDLLFFNSDYRDNSEEMNEIHRFFRNVFRSK